MKYMIFFMLCAIGCSTKINPEEITRASILAHGLNHLDSKKVSFDFRDKRYSLDRSEEDYFYTRSFDDSVGFVEDVLINSKDFTRIVDGDTMQVGRELAVKYANSVNSVLYFVQLPLTLTDPAAIKTYQGSVAIKGKTYHQIEVRFSEKDGGNDFEDVFLYWFEQETKTLDYLAYSYLTDGGGVRFREAINRRTIENIVFQDYINYKPAKKTTSLSDMLDLYKKDKLMELSRIENRDVLVN
ncbi:MAG: DUF6503 family protein [Bacteroidota bacterium]